MRAGKVVLMAVGAIAIALVLGIGIAGCQAANGATQEVSVPDFIQAGKDYHAIGVSMSLRVLEIRGDGWVKVQNRLGQKCWWQPTHDTLIFSVE